MCNVTLGIRRSKAEKEVMFMGQSVLAVELLESYDKVLWKYCE